MNHATLLKLAGINNDQDLYKELGIASDDLNNTEFGAALKELQAEETKAVIKEAAKEVLELVKQSNEMTARLVNELREIRRQEKMVLAGIKQIERAKQYAAQTNNYIPLLVAKEIIRPAVHRSLCLQYGDLAVVPADWEPKAKAAPKAQGVKKSVVKD